PICDPGLKLLERPFVFVFEVFETGVDLDAVADFFSVAVGLVSDPDGVENVINIVLDAVFAAEVVGVSVVLDNVDDDVADSDDVDAVVANVVALVQMMTYVDDDVVDYVLDDVGTDVVDVGASVILGGEDDDVVAFVSTVVVYDVDGGVVSAVEVGGVVDATVDDNVELFIHLSIPSVKN
ncbi:unnamed protein product, partial [Porites lobata]